MTESNLNFNKEGVETVLATLKEDANDIKEMFEEIEFMADALNGEDDTWKGIGQSHFYDSFKTISCKFNEINEAIDKNNDFLRITMENYQNRDNLIDNSAKQNSDNLDIN